MSESKLPKIFIVEDDTNNHLLYRKKFEDVGFEVFIVENADDNFVETVLAFAPDIISMDLVIGKNGMAAEHDGFSAIELLKSDERTKDIPIMVASSYILEEKIVHARDLGACDYFNLQGHTFSEIAGYFRAYVDAPDEYKPSHPLFRE